jgi:hypothetical protein
MSPQGRPKGEYRRATPVSAHCRSRAILPPHAARKVVQ